MGRDRFPAPPRDPARLDDSGGSTFYDQALVEQEGVQPIEREKEQVVRLRQVGGHPKIFSCVVSIDAANTVERNQVSPATGWG
jgi:hypothetical protein